MCVCVCVSGGGGGGRGGGEGGVIPWVFEVEIFNLSPLGITFKVTSTVAYSV